jgi:hypothetical protein
MLPYFTKRFDDYGLSEVDYSRCGSCGFVMSKTHVDLSDRVWEKVNNQFHASYHGTNFCPEDSHWVMRLTKQAQVIADLATIGLLRLDLPWVDFGCGDGKLSNMLRDKYSLELLKFDRFEKKGGYISEDTLNRTLFAFAITTSVFEHLRDRKHLDEIASLVADDGVMGIHTLVAEEIPCASEWFYLLPVHCAFYTNKSMQLLFDQWGYTASIYHVESRLWFWFKADADQVENIIASANARFGYDNLFYYFKRGFMDYWKCEAADIIRR